MKKYLFILPALFLALTTFAQQDVSATDPAVQTVVEKFTTKYNLNEEQVAKMVKIQQRRIKNLNEIATLETADPATFLQKRKAINTGTEVSVKMMLDKNQRLLFDEDRSEIRMKKAEKTAELKAQGMSAKDMEPYLMEIEDAQF